MDDDDNDDGKVRFAHSIWTTSATSTSLLFSGGRRSIRSGCSCMDSQQY